MLRAIRILLFALLFAGQAFAMAPQRTLLVFGDSLSAAYGLRPDQGWVALLQQRLMKEGYGYQVVNASVSGETTAGGRARLQRALAQHKPDIVVLELGANDGLRGLPVKDARVNLEAMARAIKESGARALLVGILIPPNYGQPYATSFAQMYRDIAASQKLPFLPFLLEGVALDPKLMQEDGLHPRAEASPRVLDNVWQHLRPLLERPR
jgi:acyl-CoA thioesterase-1